jgi:hypothetical protein
MDVLSAVTMKAMHSSAPSSASSARNSNTSAGSAMVTFSDSQLAILSGTALIMYKAQPTSRLKGSASLAQLLKAICGFACQLVIHHHHSENCCNLAFVCLRACVKFFGFVPNVFASSTDSVFAAAFSQPVHHQSTALAAAASAAAALCVNITLASFEPSSPHASSTCSSLVSALLSAPSNPQLIQAASVINPLCLIQNRASQSFSGHCSCSCQRLTVPAGK